MQCRRVTCACNSAPIQFGTESVIAVVIVAVQTQPAKHTFQSHGKQPRIAEGAVFKRYVRQNVIVVEVVVGGIVGVLWQVVFSVCFGEEGACLVVHCLRKVAGSVQVGYAEIGVVARGNTVNLVGTHFQYEFPCVSQQTVVHGNFRFEGLRIALHVGKTSRGFAENAQHRSSVVKTAVTDRYVVACHFQHRSAVVKFAKVGVGRAVFVLRNKRGVGASFQFHVANCHVVRFYKEHCVVLRFDGDFFRVVAPTHQIGGACKHSVARATEKFLS